MALHLPHLKLRCVARVVASSYGWTDTVLTAIYPSDNKLQLPTLLKPATGKGIDSRAWRFS